MSTLLVPAPRARFTADRRLRSVALALGVLLLAFPWLAAAPDAARPEPVPDPEQLRRALLEARDNCLVAALAARGHALAPPLFRTVELRRALRSDLLQRADLGELAAIEQEASWLAALRGSADLGARSPGAARRARPPRGGAPTRPLRQSPLGSGAGRGTGCRRRTSTPTRCASSAG